MVHMLDPTRIVRIIELLPLRSAREGRVEKISALIVVVLHIERAQIRVPNTQGTTSGIDVLTVQFLHSVESNSCTMRQGYDDIYRLGCHSGRNVSKLHQALECA